MIETVKLLVDLLKRHDSNEIARKASEFDLRLIRSKGSDAECVLKDVEELIKTSKISHDQIL